MGTSLGTIKAALQQVTEPTLEAAPLVDSVAKMWAVGIRPSHLAVTTNRCCQGTAVIPRRDYGPKQ